MSLQGTSPGALPWADLEAYRADCRARNPLPALEAVPAGLVDRPQWLVWRYEPPEKPTSKPRKMPYYASGRRRTGGQGGEADRAALVPFREAVAAAGQGFDGVGFAFLPDDGLIGIDLDGMIDADSGEVSERCAQIIAACDSYTELSPSGTGVHIICQGEGSTFKSNALGIEVFTGRQYFTFTGRPWAASPAEVRTLNPSVIRRLYVTVKGVKPANEGGEAQATPAPQADALPRASSAGGKTRSLAESVALAEEALGHVNADDYHDWIAVGMACKADLGTAGYLVWDAWSARGAKYAGSGDTRKRWEGFKPTDVSLGSLFALAEQGGWTPPWKKAKPKSRPVKKTPASVVVALPPVSAYTPSEAAAGEGIVPPPGGGEPPGTASPWTDDLLRKKGEVSSCLANAELILANMPEWRGVVAYDSFAERPVHRLPVPGVAQGEPGGEWSDYLDDRTTIWLQRKWGVEFSSGTVGKAVEVLARDNAFHPVREALSALAPWDGIRRNAFWLSECLGVEQSEYSARVGVFFLRGMIKRVMEPGCKFDYCLVLEGLQGRGKSSVARILSWNWFCDTDLDLNNKDSLLALPGHWVYELAELGSLMKAEERKQKSFLSRQEDEYRPPYGKRLVKVPRQCVFIGTTNEDEYLKDATGARRFWPVKVGDQIEFENLRANRDQMFAEALADYFEGKRCYPTPEEQEEYFNPEQEKRGLSEPLEDLVWRWVKKQTAPFSMAEAATDGMGLTADKLTPALVTRLGIVLRKLGCGRKEDRLAADPGRRRLYVNPLMERAAEEALSGAAEEVPYVGF